MLVLLLVLGFHNDIETYFSSRCVVLKAKEAEDKHIASVHSNNHIKLMTEISSKKYDSSRNKIARKYNSIYFNKGSSESAILAAGSVRGNFTSSFHSLLKHIPYFSIAILSHLLWGNN